MWIQRHTLYETTCNGFRVRVSRTSTFYLSCNSFSKDRRSAKKVLFLSVNPISRKMWSDAFIRCRQFCLFSFSCAHSLADIQAIVVLIAIQYFLCTWQRRLLLVSLRPFLVFNIFSIFLVFISEKLTFKMFQTEILKKLSWYPLFRLRKKPFSHLNLHFRPLPRFLPFRRFLRQSARPFSGTKYIIYSLRFIGQKLHTWDFLTHTHSWSTLMCYSKF